MTIFIKKISFGVESEIGSVSQKNVFIILNCTRKCATTIRQNRREKQKKMVIVGEIERKTEATQHGDYRLHSLISYALHSQIAKGDGKRRQEKHTKVVECTDY